MSVKKAAMKGAEHIRITNVQLLMQASLFRLNPMAFRVLLGACRALAVGYAAAFIVMTVYFPTLALFVAFVASSVGTTDSTAAFITTVAYTANVPAMLITY